MEQAFVDRFLGSEFFKATCAASAMLAVTAVTENAKCTNRNHRDFERDGTDKSMIGNVCGRCILDQTDELARMYVAQTPLDFLQETSPTSEELYKKMTLLCTQSVAVLNGTPAKLMDPHAEQVFVNTCATQCSLAKELRSVAAPERYREVVSMLSVAFTAARSRLSVTGQASIDKLVHSLA